MARFVEKEGKTVEEAIQLALEELGIEQEDADVEILESGSKSVLGIFGGKGAKVRVTEAISDVKRVTDFLDRLLSEADCDDSTGYDVSEGIEEGQEVINVSVTGDDVAYLIGKHGDTLYAINYIANVIVNKDKDTYKRVNIDVSDYKKHREDTLISIANKAAGRVIKYKRPVALDPMPASERRIIHTALQGSTKVTTESQGVDPQRYVVIKLKPYVKKF